MRKRLYLTFSLLSMLIVTSCVGQPLVIWQADEGAAWERRTDEAKERLIPVPIDPDQPAAGNFNLYYFVRTASKSKKNVLFFAGGPGLFVPSPTSPAPPATFADFLKDNGYNVVIFHQRGAGFSQIPASNEYDRFLKASLVVADVEAIRKDFLGVDGKWDAIIAWSYGTIVAQQYAHFHPKHVDKLVILGPQSRHEFTSSDASGKLNNAVRDINRETLANILTRFPDSITAEEQKHILDTALGSAGSPGIIERAEDAFGSIQFIIDNYDRLKSGGELDEYGFSQYSREFFQSLRALHMLGWLPPSNPQSQAGCVIIREIVFKDEDFCSEPEKEEARNASQRAFYVFGAYDRINARFLKEWLKEPRQNIADVLKRSGGKANELKAINESLAKVRINDLQNIKPWDPADYPHSRPTLLLKGGADTTSAAGQAERFYRKALTGPRALIEFPGVGHLFKLPDLPKITKPLLTGTVYVDPPVIEPGETRAVLGTYRGRQIDEHFQLKLEAAELEKELTLVGFSLIPASESRQATEPKLNERVENDGKDVSEPNVIAVVENTGGGPIDGQGRKWVLSNSIFRADIELDPPEIAPHKRSEVSGIIKTGGRNEDHAIHVKKPELEKSLELICYQLNKTPRMRMLLKNATSGELNDRQRGWTMSKGNIKKNFSFELSEPIPPEGIGFRNVEIASELSVKSSDIVELKPPRDSNLDGCVLPQKGNDERLRVVILLPDEDSPITRSKQEWRLEHDTFLVRFNLDPGSNPEFGVHGREADAPRGRRAIELTATDIKVEWKNWPTITPPTRLERGLEFRGLNVISDDTASVLLRNNSPSGIDGVAREWVYIAPAAKTGSACFDRHSLNCLIYSFLVMDVETFSNDEDNKIIGILKGKPYYAICSSTARQELSELLTLGNC